MKRLILLSGLVIFLLATGVRAQKLEIVAFGRVTLTSNASQVTGGKLDTSLVRLDMRNFIPQLVIEVDTVGTDFNEITVEANRPKADSIHTLRIAKQHTVLRHIVQIAVQADTINSGTSERTGRDYIIEVRSVSASTHFVGTDRSNLKSISPWIGAQAVNATDVATVSIWDNRDVDSRQFIVPVSRYLQMRIRTATSDTATVIYSGILTVRYVVTAIKN